MALGLKKEKKSSSHLGLGGTLSRISRIRQHAPFLRPPLPTSQHRQPYFGRLHGLDPLSDGLCGSPKLLMLAGVERLEPEGLLLCAACMAAQLGMEIYWKVDGPVARALLPLAQHEHLL
jgi:hypothetical protein